MGRIGDAYDNGMMEAFWARMQTELLNRQKWRTRLELANAIFEYLEVFHNRKRRHSASECSHPPNMRPYTTTSQSPPDSHDTRSIKKGPDHLDHLQGPRQIRIGRTLKR